jgi:hypothetical protein
VLACAVQKNNGPNKLRIIYILNCRIKTCTMGIANSTDENLENIYNVLLIPFYKVGDGLNAYFVREISFALNVMRFSLHLKNMYIEFIDIN